MPAASWIRETGPGRVLVQVIVQPRASRSEVVGPFGEPVRLKVRIAAPPVDGEANEEIVIFLSKKIGVPKSRIALVRGQTSKKKDLEIVTDQSVGVILEALLSR